MHPSKSPEAFFTLVATTAKRIVQPQDMARLMRELVVAVQEARSYDFVSLLLVDEETNELVETEVCGLRCDEHVGMTRPITPEHEGGLAGWVAYHREPVLIADVSTDARYASTVPGVRSKLAVPLLLGDTVIGVIDVGSTALGGLDECDKLLLETLAAQIAIVIENARLYEDLAKAKRELRVRNDQLQRLLGRMLELQDEERERIARDLHDGMTQTLFGALYQLDTARKRAECSPATSRDALQRLRSLIVQCVDEMDRIVHDMRPLALDDLGLTAALERYANTICRDGDEIEIEVESALRPLDPRVETAVYRIVQEALTNAVKHSRASRVRVRLDHMPTCLAVTVSDNGVGFRKVPGRGHGLGLLSIQERATDVGATLDVRSAPGRGTTLSLEVPLDDSHQPLAASACLA